MRQVRYGVFETNSSSTHSIVICTQKEYELFTKNELMYDSYNKKLVPYTSLLLKTEEDRYQDYDSFGSSDWGSIKSYCHYFTTPSGDEMVAFGEYGYDG